MTKYNVKCATDITGFGFLGHLTKLATASNVCIEINADNVPYISGAYDLVSQGCIPGASFRNAEFISKFPDVISLKNNNYERKMLMCDAQTSGGMLICADHTQVEGMLKELQEFYPETRIIGEIKTK